MNPRSRAPVLARIGATFAALVRAQALAAASTAQYRNQSIEFASTMATAAAAKNLAVCQCETMFA